MNCGIVVTMLGRIIMATMMPKRVFDPLTLKREKANPAAELVTRQRTEYTIAR